MEFRFDAWKLIYDANQGSTSGQSLFVGVGKIRIDHERGVSQITLIADEPGGDDPIVEILVTVKDHSVSITTEQPERRAKRICKALKPLIMEHILYV